jgi:uncharacterized protein YndB with AHSA1/START domain
MTEKSAASKTAADKKGWEIVITRMFDAPRELIWDAWTDPKQIVKWWGPRGFTITIHEMDVRPGGVWKSTMHGPDGTDYRNDCEFSEVVKPERIACKLTGGRKEDPIRKRKSAGNSRRKARRPISLCECFS